MNYQVSFLIILHIATSQMRRALKTSTSSPMPPRLAPIGWAALSAVLYAMWAGYMLAFTGAQVPLAVR